MRQGHNGMKQAAYCSLDLYLAHRGFVEKHARYQNEFCQPGKGQPRLVYPRKIALSLTTRKRFIGRGPLPSVNPELLYTGFHEAVESGPVPHLDPSILNQEKRGWHIGEPPSCQPEGTTSHIFKVNFPMRTWLQDPMMRISEQNI